MPDELDKLFVSNEELNKEILFEILDGKVKITEDKDVILIGELSHLEKILIYALSKKVMFVKGMEETDLVGPAEVSEKIGLASGTSKVYVRKLQKMGFFLGKGGKYSVPNFALEKIKEFLSDGQNK